MYHKILVPLDGSTLAECVLAHVKEIASGCGTGEVILLQAVEPIAVETVQYLSHVDRHNFKAEEQNRLATKQYLEDVSRRLAAQGLNTRIAIINGHPDATIPEFAESNGIDLIIMSTHGRAGVSRWFCGTTADRVVRESRIPVLLVTPEGCRI
jgi:nucleotide-binding universal stress UspA family protein